ncbi:MAG: SIS domain-containing protein [Patescibacteria group bacterium]
MTLLDDLEKIKKIDQENLANLMSKIPEQLEKVWQEREKIIVPPIYKKVKNVLICGLGCDRVTGELVKKMLEEKSSLPIEVRGDYQAPHYLSKETLVVILSYSGQTPEILTFLGKILDRKDKIKIFAISGGGELSQIVKREKIPFYEFKGQGPSRANIGYLLFALLILLRKIGLAEIDDQNFISLIKVVKEFNQILELEKKTEENVAKYLAYQIFDRLPLIVGAEHLWPVAQRWKKEFNENAKTFSFAEEAPEFFHNTVVGLEFPWRLRDEIFFLFLESDFYQPEIKKALTIFKDLLKKEKINFETIPSIGKNKLIETLTGVCLGDWVSFYLAILNQVNPTPVETIDLIKKELKK